MMKTAAEIDKTNKSSVSHVLQKPRLEDERRRRHEVEIKERGVLEPVI